MALSPAVSERMGGEDIVEDKAKRVTRDDRHRSQQVAKVRKYFLRTTFYTNRDRLLKSPIRFFSKAAYYA
jgi:hypothetical protein